MKTVGSVVIGYEWDVKTERDAYRALPAKKKSAVDDAILTKLLVHNCVATRSQHMTFDMNELFIKDAGSDRRNLPEEQIRVKLNEVLATLNANNAKRSTLPEGQSVVLGDEASMSVIYIPIGPDEHRKMYGAGLSLSTPATPWRLAVDVPDPDDPGNVDRRLKFNPRAVANFSWGVMIPRQCMSDKERLMALEQRSYGHLGMTNINPHA